MGHIAQNSAPAALKWFEKLLEKISSLRDLPYRCARASEDELLRIGLRQLVYGRYRILFVVDESEMTVKVLRVRHGAKQAIDLKDLGLDEVIEWRAADAREASPVIPS